MLATLLENAYENSKVQSYQRNSAGNGSEPHADTALLEMCDSVVGTPRKVFGKVALLSEQLSAGGGLCHVYHCVCAKELSTSQPGHTTHL